MKKITLFILFVLIQFSHSGVFGSDGFGEDKELTGGFYRITYKGEGKHKEWVYLFDYKEMEKLYNDFLRNTTNGVPFNEDLMKKIKHTLNAGINYQLEKLKDCMGGDYSKKIEAKMKAGKINLRFDDGLGSDDAYHEDEKGRANESITLSSSYLGNIIWDITKRIKDNEKWYPDNIYTLPGHTNFLTILGHEMIHSHAGIGGGHENECIAHCFTRQCLNSKHDPRVFRYSLYGSFITNPLHCDQLEFSPEIKNKMSEGRCFCGVDWVDPSNNEPCKDEESPPPRPGSSGGSGTTSTAKSYIPDPPDDHYSFSNFIEFSDDEMNSNPVGNFAGDTFNDIFCFNYYPDILIYNKYGDSSMENLVNRVMPGNYFDDYIHDYFSNNHKILVIPSAALMGDSESEIVKQAIIRFLESGGSVVLLSQQFGRDIENLIPTNGGEIGPIVGFREDSSCLKNSVYFTGMHPILSSSTTGILDVGIDGYFSVNSSSTATVLLRRKINAEPALLYYKYGQGTVFLTSLFTDYAYSRSMASTTELKLVKNMLRFAMDPDANIPMFNLDENQNPTINLNIKVTNQSETPAAKAKISVYTIENTLLYETDATVSLNQEESTDIPINFTLPDLESKEYGIGYSLYELKDTDDNLTQLKTETPGGRFSIYKLITPTNIDDRLYRWITVDDEEAYWGEEIECTIHFKNTTDQVRQIEIKDPYFFIDHGWKKIAFNSFSASINPGETYEHVVYLPTNEISLVGNDKVTFRIKYYDAEGQIRQLGAAKLVYVKKELTKSSVEMIKPYILDPGAPVNYSLHSFSEASIAGETTIKLVLEKYNRENSVYDEIQTLFQGSQDFSTGSEFQYHGSYTSSGRNRPIYARIQLYG